MPKGTTLKSSTLQPLLILHFISSCEVVGLVLKPGISDPGDQSFIPRDRPLLAGFT